MKTYPRILIALGFGIALLAAFGIGMHLSARAAATSEKWSFEDITAGQANYPTGLTSDANPVEENLYQGQGSTYDSSTGAYNSSLWVNSDNHVAMHTE